MDSGAGVSVDTMTRIVTIIPAYNPPASFLGLVNEILATVDWDIIIVDDGSGVGCKPIFEALPSRPGVKLLTHGINLGKGAALKTALNYGIARYGDDVVFVTVDADGQHSVKDMIALGLAGKQETTALFLGVRSLLFATTPLRSFAGNTLTRGLVYTLLGLRLRDTQTGLRAIPAAFAKKLLKIEANGYDFELEMLIMAQHMRLSIRQIAISTIYDKGNTTSHFKPIVDSAKIYAVLFQFFLISMFSALVDNLIFVSFVSAGVSTFRAYLLGRCIAAPFNFVLLRRYVFYSQRRFPALVAIYVITVIVFFLASNFLVGQIVSIGISPVAAKMIVESAMFPLSFLIQRDFVFAQRGW